MKNSRRNDRKCMAGEVEFFTNGGVPLGDLRDISLGGLSVTTSTPYQVGYEMFISVKPSEAPEPIAVLAEVVWVTPLEAAFHTTGMGLKFLDLREEDFYKLEKIMELT